MDFRGATNRGVGSIAGVGMSLGGGGGSRLSLYQLAPPMEVSLEEFEQYALDRLHVLIAIEENRSRGKKAEQVETAVMDVWKKYMRTSNAADALDKDLISHFVLRLVYSRTEELRRWFLELETALFKLRFRNEKPEAQKSFMEENKLPYKTISYTEFETLRDKLSQVARSLNHPLPTGLCWENLVILLQYELSQMQMLLSDVKVKSCNLDLRWFSTKCHILPSIYKPCLVFCLPYEFMSTKGDSSYYKVPFEEVLELVANRKIYLQQGHAFVPRDQLVAIVANHFRLQLSQALLLTNRKWTTTFAEKEDDRLTPIIEALSMRYLGPDYSKPRTNSNVGLQDLDSLALKSFPLCMRHLYVKLKEDHHLRHGGRQQLGLFLKGVGLNLEDALAFWRSEFSHKMGGDKFDKEYAYNVRHNYGKEGKRTEYTPHSCMKIIMATPGVGDQHGCPYRHFSQENLHAALTGMRLSMNVVDDVMGKARNHHYQLACAATFEGVHGCQCDGINHPNQYFEQSQKSLQPQPQNGGGIEESDQVSTTIMAPSA